MNAAGLWQGQADPPLSRVGRGQARALAQRLADAGEARELAALATSDLRRARQTAEILGERLALRPLPLRALRERDVGAWSGRSHAQIAARWPHELRRFRAGEDLRPGGGENRSEFLARLRSALAELAERWPGRPVAIVTHLGVLRALHATAAPGNAEALWLELQSAARRLTPPRRAPIDLPSNCPGGPPSGKHHQEAAQEDAQAQEEEASEEPAPQAQALIRHRPLRQNIQFDESRPQPELPSVRFSGRGDVRARRRGSAGVARRNRRR